MKNKHEVNIKIEGKEWNDALDKSFNKNVVKTKVDGFREGKCPREVYEKKFGKDSLFMDAVDFVIEDAYKKAISDSKLVPIVQPTVDIKKIDEKGVEFAFSIITKPEVKIKKYKGLKIKKEKITVTNEEINNEVDMLKKQYAEVVSKDGAIELGDTTVIDFEGFSNGVPFAGGKGENYPLEIGSNTFIPGFEVQLIGLKTNDEKDITVTFPNDYPSDELKGKEVIFKVKIHEVKTKKIPELNEDFFLDLGLEEVKNKEDLLKKIKNDIETRKETEAENKHIDLILSSIAENTVVELPSELVEAEVGRMLEQYDEKLKTQGVSLEQYLEFTKSSIDTLKDTLKIEAKKNVLYRNIIEEVAKQENISVSDDDANEEATKMAENYKMEKDELIKAFGGLDMIKYDLEMRKTIKFLTENN